MSKFDPDRIKDGSEKLCTNKQTNKQSNRHYENNGHLAMNQFSVKINKETHDSLACDNAVGGQCISHLCSFQF